MALPGNAGTTTTAYQANKITATSPAGKWKSQEVDAAGNLVKVTEPNPAGGTWDTAYVYNDRNMLLTVTTARPSSTQVRSFTYNNAGQALTSTNPENGTVTNTYDGSTALLSYKVDAKENKVSYYDSLLSKIELHQLVVLLHRAHPPVNLRWPLQRVIDVAVTPI